MTIMTKETFYQAPAVAVYSAAAEAGFATSGTIKDWENDSTDGKVQLY